MTDDKSKGAGIVEKPVPSVRAPAEGAPDQLPAEEKGKNPNIDPAAKNEPAEGGRDEVEQNAERKS